MVTNALLTINNVIGIWLYYYFRKKGQAAKTS
jgi:hypothetical protein